MSLEEQSEFSQDQIDDMNKTNKESDWLGWRYIPNVTGPGAALNHPTTFPQGGHIKSAQLCTGEIEWTALPWHLAPTQAHILEAMAGLPVLDVTASLVTRGESYLIGDKSRELK